MKLKSMRVENFKLVEDSTEFSLRDLTCLVGKNEAGKTALLQALQKLKPAVDDDANFEVVLEYPRRKYSEYKEQAEDDNVLTTKWELDEADVAAVEKALGPNALASRSITVEKGYDNQTFWTIGLNEKNVVSHLLGAVSDVSKEDRARLKAEHSTVAELRTALGAIPEPEAWQVAILERITALGEGDAEGAAIGALEGRLPTFVYFANYQQMPGEVSIDVLRARKEADDLDFGDRVFLALLDLAGTSAEDIDTIGRYEELRAELEAVSSRLSQEIFAYWSQNRHLRVEFYFDAARPEDPPPLNTGFIFRTRIYNQRHGVTVGFDQRSAGFVWFFSFLIWFSQVKKNYGENLILLLDEPGLGLHGKAQEDLLRYIKEKLVPLAQVVYTTHSPFMIDPDDLLSARTVEDRSTDAEVEGTKVGDEVLSTDVDTLFPLQAALGYDITQTLFVGKNPLLVEGPSDLLYLTWFSAELERRERERLDRGWTISPSGGLDKIASFLTLFAGSKLHCAVVADFHQGDKQKVRNLRESELLKAGHVFTIDSYVAGNEADIEDLIGRDAYIDLVNRTYGLSGKQALPKTQPSDAPVRVVEEVEKHFRTLPDSVPEFDHYTPAAFLVEHGAELRDALAGIDEALDRFEALFKDLNPLV